MRREFTEKATAFADIKTTVPDKKTIAELLKNANPEVLKEVLEVLEKA